MLNIGQKFTHRKIRDMSDKKTYEDGNYYYAKCDRWSNWEIVLFKNGEFLRFEELSPCPEDYFEQVHPMPICIPAR